MNSIAGVGEAEVALLRGIGVDVDFYPLPIMGGRLPFLLKMLLSPVRLLRYLPILHRIRQGAYDVVHVHFVSQGLIGLFAKPPLVIHAHGSDLRRNLRNPLLAWLSWRVLDRAAWVFYVTPDLARYLGGRESKSALLGNPIDTGLFHPAAPPASVSRVLIFARLDAVKGADQVFGHVREMSAEFGFAAVAAGEWAERYGHTYGDVVHFIQPVSRAGVRSLLVEHDVVVGQMAAGVLGLSELEALACGRPVIMRLDAQLYEDDPPPVVNISAGGEILDALRRLRAHPEEMARLSRAGVEWIQRNHDGHTHASRLREVYSRVLEGSAGAQLP